MTTAPRTWRLDLPITKPLSLNHRMHHMAKWREEQKIRRLTMLATRMCAVPTMGRCEVQLHFIPKRRGRRDTDNLMATAKYAFDGIVAAGVVPDDTPEFMVKPEPIIDPVDSSAALTKRVYLVITELDTDPTVGHDLIEQTW